jgi:formylglycine-generating enzyme required for sulfatase activity
MPDRAVFQNAPFAPRLVVISAGEFMMGSLEGEEGRFDSEGPQHRVTIGRRFAIGRYPVTFEEYDRFCEATQLEKPDDMGWGRGQQPVINVNWNDAHDYIAWLSRETGRPYRLPSEAEWEYACRAGTTTRYWFGDTITLNDASYDEIWSEDTSNYSQSALGFTSKIGLDPANPWGLHDMHGNVWEWVEDHWHDNYRGAPTDGSAWEDMGAAREPGEHVLRGGSFTSPARDCRSASRGQCVTDLGHNDTGFRVARALS